MLFEIVVKQQPIISIKFKSIMKQFMAKKHMSNICSSAQYDLSSGNKSSLMPIRGINSLQEGLGLFRWHGW